MWKVGVCYLSLSLNWMSEIQWTESEFTIHVFLSQEVEIAQLPHFVPNLFPKIFNEIINIINNSLEWTVVI